MNETTKITDFKSPSFGGVGEAILATYFIETPYEPEQAAQVLAGEQSSGTFIAVPGETAALKERFAAKVISVEHLETVDTPAIPGATSKSGKYHRAIVKVSWSIENFGYNLPVLISTLQGNLYEIKQFTGLKLMDIELPQSYYEHYSGPAFGVMGCRQLTNVVDRPLIGTIIKPSVGLAVSDTVDIVNTLVNAGIDFIKDDELLSSSANSNFFTRVEEVMKVINNHQQKTGKKVMFAFNLSGEMDEMLYRYEHIVKHGGTCAMININSVGISATKKLCDQKQVAIHAHRNGWGMFNRHPLLGMEFAAYHKIWSLAGVDQLHVNGIKNKFWESDESVVRSIKNCSTPFHNHKNVLPVVSSGQWGGQAFETYQLTNTVDLLYMAGGGIMAHPMGASAGVVALQQAWQSAVEGLTLEQTANKYKEFNMSVEKFGK
jgi:ribulose-bisphosphate carboxylase large chain